MIGIKKGLVKILVRELGFTPAQYLTKPSDCLIGSDPNQQSNYTPLLTKIGSGAVN